jgi:glucose-6-phosphate isomerase
LAHINFKNTATYPKLKQHFEQLAKTSLKDLFAQDSKRFDKFSIRFEDILVDYSKNFITQEIFDLFLDFAKELKLKEQIDNMFSGEKINETENRAVLHTALRNLSNKPIYFEGRDVMPDVKMVLKQIKNTSQTIRNGNWKGFTGKRITDIVNIGIGGSDLGSKMVTQALTPYHQEGLKVHFIANIDSSEIHQCLKPLNPKTTLFIICSKSFTTQETIVNAQTARSWFLKEAQDTEHIKQHFIAISTNKTAVAEFGISEQNRLGFWDWVGGRYSLWSAVGLSIACAIGFENFEQLLKGAYAMDTHFHTTSFDKNAPVIMAFLGFCYSEFFNADAQAILPYNQYLQHFPAFLQQLDMESNGKQCDRNGKRVDYLTGSIIWGAAGTNGQHAFYQLIHQGTKFIPCDFIAPATSHNPICEHHDILLANFFAQPEALMNGKTRKQVKTELKNQGKSDEYINKIAPFKVFEGNTPTNSLLLKKITPYTLGSLVALYEHKVFVQGLMWNIFSFDQWGVELGKELAKEILPKLKNNDLISSHDSSTNALINAYKEMKKD